MTRRRALILLMAYLPLVAVSMLHQHGRSAEQPCDDCVHHVAHSGHIGGNDGGHNCFYCQMQDCTYYASGSVAMERIEQLCDISTDYRLPMVAVRRAVRMGLRSPPAC